MEWLNVEINGMVFFICSFFPFIFVISMKNLRMVGNVCILSTLIVFGGLGFFYWNYYTVVPPLDDIKITFPIVIHLPAFFGSLIMSLEAITVISSFEGSLRTPKRFTKFFGIFNLGMIIIIAIHSSVGFFGYYMKINDEKSYSDQAAKTFKYYTALYCIVMYIAYGLQGYILVDMLWRKTHKRTSNTKI
ncbi:hypothetical protein HHI36_000767 [Cryptolaemus montrouzieri]|uniref:Uncharacterized protein n=1 Tax=Cryptolaemus montrouzieri TaxID=559131 RepID=A0ABD2P6B7_9CUCU